MASSSSMRRLAVLAQHPVELDQVHRGVQRDAQPVSSAARRGGLQQLDRAGVELRRIEHAADAAVVGAVVLAGAKATARSRPAKPARGRVEVPRRCGPARRRRRCYCEARAQVDPRARARRPSRRAPPALRAADVDDRGGAAADRRPEAVLLLDVGAIEARRGGGAPRRRGVVGDEVGAEVVGLGVVEEEDVRRVAAGVEVAVHRTPA